MNLNSGYRYLTGQAIFWCGFAGNRYIKRAQALEQSRYYSRAAHTVAKRIARQGGRAHEDNR